MSIEAPVVYSRRPTEIDIGVPLDGCTLVLLDVNSVFLKKLLYDDPTLRHSKIRGRGLMSLETVQ